MILKENTKQNRKGKLRFLEQSAKGNVNEKRWFFSERQRKSYGFLAKYKGNTKESLRFFEQNAKENTKGKLRVFSIIQRKHKGKAKVF